MFALYINLPLLPSIKNIIYMKQLDIFYNTINEINPSLAISKKKVNKQNEKVLQLFKQFPGTNFTPCEVHKHFPDSVPLTSIRRAITCLTTVGELVKQSTQRMGIYGKMNYTWKLK